MKVLVCLVLHVVYATGAIRESLLLNKFLNEVKPVGPLAVKKFVPLTEIPPPHNPHVHKDGRRHFEDCSPKPAPREVLEGATVDIFGEYYDDHIAKTVATVIIPDHIDRRHFEVTTPIPYLTVGPIEAMGFHPSVPPQLDECEKIYQDHINEQYSGDESDEVSEESLEMARVPVAALNPELPPTNVYDDNNYGI